MPAVRTSVESASSISDDHPEHDQEEGETRCVARIQAGAGDSERRKINGDTNAGVARSAGRRAVDRERVVAEIDARGDENLGFELSAVVGGGDP